MLGIQRTASARSKTQCTLYKISKKKLFEVLRDFPESFSKMKRVAESRHRRLKHYINPEQHPLLPNDEIDSEDCKTELFGVDAENVVTLKEEESMKKSRQSHRMATIQRRPAQHRAIQTSRHRK